MTATESERPELRLRRSQMEGRRRRRRTELKRGNECDGTATEPDQRAELRPRWNGRTVSVGGNERVLLSSTCGKRENRNQVQDLISV